MLGDVLDALAVDVHRAVVGERGEILRAGLRRLDGDLARGFRPCGKRLGFGHGVVSRLELFGRIIDVPAGL